MLGFGKVKRKVQALQLILKIVPIAMQLIPVVEKLFKSEPGQSKKAIAVSLIIPAVQAAETIAGRDLIDEVALKEAVEAIIDSIVAGYNAINFLKPPTA